ncbi:MAG: pentapeptide repeat-containing protein, partial [Brevundimonas sp.]
MTRRLSTAGLALGAAVAALASAGSASAEIQFQLGLQDRDVARMVSLGGSCNRCELSGRDLTGAAFTGAVFTNATLVGA